MAGSPRREEKYFIGRGQWSLGCAIVQYDSSKKQVLTDFLGSWELLPGTVAYAGYGSLIEERGWNGAEWTEAPPLSYRTSQRGFFFKASYIHRF